MYLNKAILHSSLTVIQRSQCTKPQARDPAIICSLSGVIIYARLGISSHRILEPWSNSIDESRLEDDDNQDCAAGKSLAAKSQAWTRQEYCRPDSDRIPVCLLDLPM